LIDSLPEDEATAFHFDGAFASPQELVRETFLGRNYGWLASERGEALRHFARVVRADSKSEKPYREVLQAISGLDITSASDDAVLDAATGAVVAYVRSLRFSRDEAGQFNWSPYDEFLSANRLPRGPAPGESERSYSHRLSELIAALPRPVYVDAAPGISSADRGHGFGPLELEGLRIFFRAAVGPAQKSGAGNCAECHVPPRFTDFKFHNTGVAQAEYDAVHGAGAFARLVVPSLRERDADDARWLPSTTAHPERRCTFVSVATAADAGRADLGLWNIYANDDFAEAQPALGRLLNPASQRTTDAVLGSCIGAFKTPTIRGLRASAPYLHTGAAPTLVDVIELYRRASVQAREGGLRNSPAEFFAMRLQREDTAPLAAFLGSLDDSLR
jgi:cytochrome c peroxidase